MARKDTAKKVELTPELEEDFVQVGFLLHFLDILCKLWVFLV